MVDLMKLTIFLLSMLMVCWREVAAVANSRSEEMKIGAHRAEHLLSGYLKNFYVNKWLGRGLQGATDGFEQMDATTSSSDDQWQNIVEVLAALSDADFFFFEDNLRSRIVELGNQNVSFDFAMLIGIFQTINVQLKYNKADEKNAKMFEPENKIFLSSILECWLGEMLDLIASVHRMLHDIKNQNHEVFAKNALKNKYYNFENSQAKNVYS